MARDPNIVDLTRGYFRRIYAGFVHGRRINSVSLGAEAWFWRINAVADDFGNFYGDAARVRNYTQGLRDMRVEEVAGFLEELAAEANALIVFYESSGEKYLHILEFESLQPGGKNGRRCRKFPPWNGEAMSGCIRVHPGATRPHHNQYQDHNQDQDQSNLPADAGLDEEIYREYPRKVGKTKAVKAIHYAKKRIAQLGNTDPHGWLLERTRAYADARRELIVQAPEEAKFTPHPATWFSQGRYDDDPAEWQGSRGPARASRNGNSVPGFATTGVETQRKRLEEICKRTKPPSA